MNILLFNSAWNNRGDESALRAMIDEVRQTYPNIKFTFFVGKEMQQFPYENDSNINVVVEKCFTRKNYADIPFLILSKGKFAVTKEMKSLITQIKKADFVLHAPGGPSMGDIYKSTQYNSYFKFLITKALKKPYGFYAPSMGPFNKKAQNILRKKIYNGAEFITTREALSAEYAKKLNLKKDVIVTLDSAVQHKINHEKYENQLKDYSELNDFLKTDKKIIGITITDLMWHPNYLNNPQIKSNIENTFKETIKHLTQSGYKIVFIPQLFGLANDYDYMKEFAINDNCFVIDDKHDCFFQQYIIEKLHFVIGLRYHSNVFSAKMKTPFISISYEQKMRGFTQLIGLEDYCINISDLSADALKEKISKLESNYSKIKNHLCEINNEITLKSKETTMILENKLKKLNF